MICGYGLRTCRRSSWLLPTWTFESRSRIRARSMAIRHAKLPGERQIVVVAGGERGAGQHVSGAGRQHLESALLVEKLRGIVGAHRKLDHRAADGLCVRGDTSDHGARYAVAAIGGFDEKILQKNDRPAPAGDDAL